MDDKNFLSLQILGLKVTAMGRFSIVALLIAAAMAGVGYVLARHYGFW